MATSTSTTLFPQVLASVEVLVEALVSIREQSSGLCLIVQEPLSGQSLQ